MALDNLAFVGYNQHELQHALAFLAINFERSGHNTKPVVLHSVRVALLLANNRAPQNSVLAGMLHDCLEDTDVAAKDLETQFGKIVSDIVVSLTFDKPSNDLAKKLEAAADSFDRSLALGRDALVVRACDLVDNSYFYDKANGLELAHYLHKKYALFMDKAKPLLSGSPFWDLLQKAYDQRVKPLADV